MSKITFDDYAYHARNTAFYLDYDPDDQFKLIHQGYNEELGELLNDDDSPVELTSKLWGLQVDDAVSRKLNQSKVSEAGDVLYYISAACSLREVSLRSVAAEAIARYTAETTVDWDESIKSFDRILAGKMSESVPSAYRPNYSVWKLWDFAPFEDGLHIVLREPAYAKGPLRLIPDGRYALERLHSTLGRYFSPEAGSKEDFTAAAALALGGLSIVLQGRFNGSLHRAAINNIEKRERRQSADALWDGPDTERSRQQGMERRHISNEEGSEINLLNAPLPEL